MQTAAALRVVIAQVVGAYDGLTAALAEAQPDGVSTARRGSRHTRERPQTAKPPKREVAPGSFIRAGGEIC